MYIKDLMDKPFWYKIQNKLNYKLEIFTEPACIKDINNIQVIHFQRKNYIYSYEKYKGRNTYDNLIIVLYNDELITLYCGNSDKSNYSYFQIGDILYIITKSSVEVVDCIDTVSRTMVDCENVYRF